MFEESDIARKQVGTPNLPPLSASFKELTHLHRHWKLQGQSNVKKMKLERVHAVLRPWLRKNPAPALRNVMYKIHTETAPLIADNTCSIPPKATLSDRSEREAKNSSVPR